MVKLAVGNHCCHCSLLAVMNFTASSDCWQLKFHCQQSLSATACGEVASSEKSLLAIASSEKSLLPTASSEQSLFLLPTVTYVRVHARACTCAEVYMHHWACNMPRNTHADCSVGRKLVYCRVKGFPYWKPILRTRCNGERIPL